MSKADSKPGGPVPVKIDAFVVKNALDWLQLLGDRQPA
jgi:hypothetical protein